MSASRESIGTIASPACSAEKLARLPPFPARHARRSIFHNRVDGAERRGLIRIHRFRPAARFYRADGLARSAAPDRRLMTVRRMYLCHR